MSSVVLQSLAATRGVDAGVMATNAMSGADADMRHILDILKAMDPRPIEAGSAVEARARPTLASALHQLLKGRESETGIGMELRMIPGPAGDIRARVYRPAGAAAGEKLPMILYSHGGGFVIGDFDHADTTPRALSARCRAVVVAAHYRQAPEFKFPAAHEDARAAWAWMIEHAGALGGDGSRAAVVGEDAGANLAVEVAIAARDGGGGRPRHAVLVSPMAGTDLTLPSHIENMDSFPVGTPTIRWFLKQATRNKAALGDPRLNLIERSDLGGLPPTTIILAGIDPLRSEGEALADALRRSGVWVDRTVYDGVTHGFFGLAQVVNKAMFAQGQAVRNLRESLA
jgi:acetyl esterase